jgi:hypothetical protein
MVMTAMRKRLMAVAAKDAMEADKSEAIVDKGYYKSEEIVACEVEGITTPLLNARPVSLHLIPA